VLDAKSLPSRLSKEERNAVEREQDGLGCRLLSTELREKLGYDEDKGSQIGRCLFPADKSKNVDGLCLHSDECPKTTKAHCDTSKLNSGEKVPGSTIGVCVAGNGGGNTTIVAGGVETGSEEKEEHSRCSEQNADLWDTEDLSKVEWQYSGIVYFKLDTTSRLEDLDNAQDEDDPSLFAMGFSLRFDLLKMAQGDFMQTVDDHENSKEASANRFLMPLLEKCGEQGTSDPFYHLCKAQSAYRSVFWDVSAARQKERTERDPCRIDPEIDRSAYTELDSQYWFHGFQIGPHTVDGSGAVRSNKRCYICAADRANTYGKDNKNQNAVVKGLKSVGSMINTHVFNEIDYRCKTDHTGVRNSGDQKAKKLMTSERVAALDLFDEEDVKKDRARQALDLIVETVLRHLYDKHVDPEFKSSDENKPSTVVKNAEGGFWARVASDQLGQGQEVGSWNEEKYVALVAVCDEVGMDNLKVKMPGIGRTQSLFPQASPSADVYGGTVCAQIGFRSHCVQYAVPFEDMMKAQGIMESSHGRKSDEAEAVINTNLKIWYGDNNKPNQPGAELEIDYTGHAFFFNVFVSAMQSNFEDKDKLKKCLPKDEMQTAESLPLEDCDNRDQICKPPPELRANEGEISVNIEEGARCHSNPLNGDDADMVYAQRLVDPDTCNDLLRRHVRKNSEQIKAFVE
jgi:hypothetical protein